VWVAPEWRRRGVGRQLVAAICSWAAEVGVAAVRLDVEAGNAGAHTLYTASGFTPTGRTRPYRDRPHLTQVELELLLQ
jgi:[ribosomal protein S18]-alanine N-acetyltransferase